MFGFTRHGFREMLIGVVVLTATGVGLGWWSRESWAFWPVIIIPLLESIAAVQRQATVYSIKKFFS